MMKKEVTQGSQTLRLDGLKFSASLGILPEEINRPQPIQVSVELNLGMQPLAPVGDDIESVLDYRLIREAIIKTCTAEHTYLLETLIGKVAQKLLKLSRVIGVRVHIVKLKIFDDCEVAIQMEAGQW